ncbi:hypothetical protein GCM10019016_130160 [Streptomyces prasinosporus]|uniref:Uncharacterized protein n=1 Tax=Streptomyces prasinosporus TaxID=68256 RepID=A0ABP6UGX8_9ACTN|nr:hypothetical protein GCM10018777_41140 [Streptomyces viridodiastaticus]
MDGDTVDDDEDAAEYHGDDEQYSQCAHAESPTCGVPDDRRPPSRERSAGAVGEPGIVDHL